MAGQTMTAMDKSDGPLRPYAAYRFKLVIKGITLGHFKSCSGLKHEIEVLEFQEGGVNEFKHKLIGQGSYPNLTLKMGFVSNGIAEDWHNEFAAESRKGQRRTVSIVLLNTDGSEIQRWDLLNGWPVKWEGPEFDASADNVAIETLEIAHHGLLGAPSPSAGGVGGGFGGLPSMPNLPGMPSLPPISMPQMPSLPGMPSLGGGVPTDPAAAAQAALDRAREGAKAAARNAMPRLPF